MRELLFGNSPNNWTPPKPNAPPTYQHSYSTPVYHHQLDNYGFNPTMRYSMRSERGLPISLVFKYFVYNTVCNGRPSMSIGITGALFTMSLSVLILNSQCKDGASNVH